MSFQDLPLKNGMPVLFIEAYNMSFLPNIYLGLTRFKAFEDREFSKMMISVCDRAENIVPM